jgi:hypothetical protein
MPESLATLLPLLSLLATAGGAGYAASWLFDALRRRWPCPTRAQWRDAASWQRLAWRTLYAPRQARLAVFALATLVSLLASVALALLSGADPLRAADAVLSASLAVIVSQLAQPQSAAIEPKESAS